jgi:hypothetical protein
MAIISVIRKGPGAELRCRQSGCGRVIPPMENYACFRKNNTQSVWICMDCIGNLLHELLVRNTGRA